MLSPDVNVLVYAHREDSHAEHPRFAAWVTTLATSPEPFALSLLALFRFVRVVTNPRVFRRGSTLDEGSVPPGQCWKSSMPADANRTTR